MDTSPATIPIQPRPVQCLASTLSGVTAITRIWRPGDTQRCLLCPTCTADHAHGVCTVQTTVPVGPDVDSVLYFSLHTLIVQEGPGLRGLWVEGTSLGAQE